MFSSSAVDTSEQQESVIGGIDEIAFQNFQDPLQKF